MTEKPSFDAMQPLAFAILAGLTPPEIKIEFFDERVEKIPACIESDLVAISIESFTARRGYQIAARLRKSGNKVVLGGYHPTFLPEEASLYADSIVMGEAENVWGSIVADLKKGRLAKIYRAGEFPHLNNVKYDRKIFKNKRYVPITPVEFGRGCKYDCEFCSVRAFYPQQKRHRQVREVIKELEENNAKKVFFVDDNMFVNREKIKQLFNALIPLKIKWGCQISIDIADDEEMLKLMKKSGCACVLIGFESLSKDNLKQMGKGANLASSDFNLSVEKIKKHGLMIYGTFVFGYDKDNNDSFKASLDFSIRHKFFLANFNSLMPMPGTKLYERLKKEGRLIHEKWWLDENFKYGDSMFIPKNLTADELSKGCFEAKQKFNQYSSIFKRSLNRGNLNNAWVFWLSNLISRKEIIKKQGSTPGT